MNDENIQINHTRVVFTEGGKGGVGKTEVAASLVSWYRAQDLQPALLDFDIENTNKSGFQNFFPEARKFDVHKPGVLDEFFDVCEEAPDGIVLADLPAGAGEAIFQWFEMAFQDADELGLRFTAIGVTTNDAGAVQSKLKWAAKLQDAVEYLVVFNEMGDTKNRFEYWHDEPATKEFTEIFDPHFMTMSARIPEFQTELRNQAAPLQAVIDRKVNCDFLKKTKSVVRAKRHQRELFAGFDAASPVLLP